MEFTIPAPLGAHTNLLANTPVRKPPDSSKIERTTNSEGARADMHNSKKHAGSIMHGPLPTRSVDEVEIAPETLAGPPPSFQVNVLEMDRKLQQKLAHIEAERALCAGATGTMLHGDNEVADNNVPTNS